jgi:O-methyltransferase
MHKLKTSLHRIGASLIRRTELDCLPSDLSDAERRTIRQVRPYTMTSISRIIAFMHTVEHVHRAGIPGSIVECGVWRGGGMMAAASTLLALADTSRDLFLYDTFSGMSLPTAEDHRIVDGRSATDLFKNRSTDNHGWCEARLDDVHAHMLSTGYPPERIHCVAGPVEETLPARAPNGPIAVLRLDTDWYASTRHELEHLYPRLSGGGILILDDYGHWAGARKAVDELLDTLPIRPFLHRIDYTGRLLVKPH